MFTKNQMIAHLDNFISYATETAGFEKELLQPLADTLQESIEDYYSVPIELKIRHCIEAVTHSIMRATSQGKPIPQFADIRIFFEAPDAFMYSAIEELTDSLYEITDEVTGLVTGYESDIISSIILSLDTEADTINEMLSAYASQAESSNLVDPVKVLYDSDAKIEELPDMAQIAEIVFLDLGFVEVVQTFALSIYIPASIGGTP